MAEAVITKVGREKLCKAHAGDIALPRIKQIAYGDGGADGGGIPLTPTGSEAALKNELLRLDIGSHSYPSPATCEYKSSLTKEQLANTYISELGLFDEDGDLIVYKTCLPKGKDDDMIFDFSVQEIF